MLYRETLKKPSGSLNLVGGSAITKTKGQMKQVSNIGTSWPSCLITPVMQYKGE